MITAIYAALAVFFGIYLTFHVINVRRSEKISVGHDNNPKMERAMRVQANFIESTPFALLLLLLLEIQDAHGILLHIIGIALIASRVLHFIGFRTKEASGTYRFVGMIGTIAVLGISGALNLLFGLHIL